MCEIYNKCFSCKMFVKHLNVIFLCLVTIKEILCVKYDCLTPDGSKGVCVPITECPFVQNILYNSPRPLPRDIANTLNSYTCGFYKDVPNVCCKNDTFTTGRSLSSRKNLNEDNAEYQPEDQLEDQSEDQSQDVSTHRNLNLLPLKNCGDISQGRISKGNKTVLFEFPWMALLRYNDGVKNKFLCGGSLISDRYVLTAAHCVTKLKSTIKLVAVRLGEHDTRTEIDCEILGTQKICTPPVQDIPVEHAFAHQLYGKLPKFSNDIAIIRLVRAANTAAENIQPICLPTTLNSQNTVLRRVSIAGWGATESGRSSPVLLQAILPVVSNDVCQRTLKMVDESIEIVEHQMCAGGETGIDGCKGDSGGLLSYPASVDGVRMVQFGIISIGVPDCSGMHSYPGVYVRVASFMRWILNHMKQ